MKKLREAWRAIDARYLWYDLCAVSVIPRQCNFAMIRSLFVVTAISPIKASIRVVLFGDLQ